MVVGEEGGVVMRRGRVVVVGEGGEGGGSGEGRRGRVVVGEKR